MHEHISIAYRTHRRVASAAVRLRLEPVHQPEPPHSAPADWIMDCKHLHQLGTSKPASVDNRPPQWRTWRRTNPDRLL